MVEKRKISNKMIILIIVILLTVAIGGTYAWFNMTVKGSDYLITSGQISVNYQAGTPVINGSIYPENDKSNGISTTVNLGLNNNSLRACGTLELEITDISSELATNALIWEVYRNTEIYPIATGNFNGKVTGNTITLIDTLLTTASNSYTLYIWLNGDISGNEVYGGSFSGTIKASARQTNAGSSCSILANNLMTNGYGEYQNNTNFSAFTFDTSEKYNGTLGSFKLTGNSYAERFSNEYIPVDINKEYILSTDVKSNGTGATYYVGFRSYDIDYKWISADHIMYTVNTLTTLTQDLKDGDTVVYLNNISNWENASTTSTNRLGFIFWNYKDSTGYLYPELTYSRNAWRDLYLYTGIDKVNNTITLKTAWDKGTIPAGTKLSQSSYWHSFNCSLMVNGQFATNWTTLQATISGINDNSTNDIFKFWYGTKYIKFQAIFNYNSTPNTTAWFNNIQFYEKK